jgi:deazaflavin-dependent oxidoreductase (nitroreductase family)
MSSPIDELHEWNRKMVDDFRAHGGKPGGPFAGSPLLLLHTRGARTGEERINPLMYQDLTNGRVAVFATANGAPTNPDWYFNLVVNPNVSAEIGAESRRFRAYTAFGEEREEVWSRQKLHFPSFANFEISTARLIPVVILEPR